MLCLGKHVDEAPAVDLPAVGAEGGHVPDEAGGFTGDVDHLAEAVVDDFCEGFGVDALAGRIEDDVVGLFGKVAEAGEDISG